MDKFQEYIDQMDPKWKDAYTRLLEVIRQRIPADFELVWQYDMPTFIVPLQVYPQGYLDRTDEGVPFISLAAQKEHISLYHMGLMGNPELLHWFQQAYSETVPTKLNMGKSCIRLTNPNNIPYALIGELVSKMSMQEWLDQYNSFIKKKR
mgnify:CR=1 FL=1